MSSRHPGCDIPPHRRAKGGRPAKLVGYAARFYDAADPGTEFVMEDMHDYRLVERVAPGAFSRALRERQKVAGLFNHSADHVLGRTASGTLRLKEDKRGLHYEIDPPDTLLGRDLAESIRRGDLSGSSFAFGADEVDYSEGRTPDGRPLAVRTLRDCNVYDVGPVTFPAYPAAAVALDDGSPDPLGGGTRTGRFDVAKRMRQINASLAAPPRTRSPSPVAHLGIGTAGRERRDDPPGVRVELASGKRSSRRILSGDMEALAARRSALESRKKVALAGSPGESRSSIVAALDGELLRVGASMRVLLSVSDRVTSEK